MKRGLAVSFVVILSYIVLLAPVQAGPVFDDLLNYAVVDQRCPEEAIKEEGMGMVTQNRAQFIDLTSEKPLGQTFRLGPDVSMLWRVCVGLCHWPDSWEEGEAVTFTLWDSPTKSRKLYSRTIDFEHKWFKWDVVFDTHLPAEPESEFYFELTHNGGGDGVIRVAYMESGPYGRGRGYLAGQPQEWDLYFVALTKPKPDREANLRRFFSRFDLDHPALAKAKASFDNGNLDEAAALLLEGVEEYMRQSDWLWRPDRSAPYDSSRMDAVVDQGRLYGDEGRPGAWIEMSSHTTWREVWPETSSYPRMNNLFADLGYAYYVTGNEKYAEKLNELMADYAQDNASPFEGGMRGGRWVAMFQAWRLGDAWDGYATAIDSKGLTSDVRLAWLDYWSRMAHFAITEHSGGNHANAVAEALMSFSSRFPFFSDSKKWFQGGFDKLVSNSLKLFREDGGCAEPAMNYHGFSLANLLSGMDTARKFGMEMPPELYAKLEKALSFTAYMLKPDGQIPTYGDTNCEEFRPNIKKWDGWRGGEAMTGARMFGRSDLLYIATAGREGTRPASDSYSFPLTGHYILRSDWGGENGKGFEEARYLFLRGGRQGSHGHDDMNQVTLYAYGRPLLIDPGRTTYGTPLMFELSKNRSHSVLLVDELDRMNHVSPTLHAWHTSPVMDFVDNGYIDLYPGVDHRRAIVFVRPGYYVMFDRAAAKESRDLGINFWLTPPAVKISQAFGTVTSTEPDGANIVLAAADPSSIEITQRNGTTDTGKQVRTDMPVVTFWQRGKTEAGFATVLYPFPAGRGAPRVHARRTRNEAGELCVVKLPEGTDYVYYSPEASGSCEADAGFAGRAGLIRTTDSRTPCAFALAAGTRVALGGVVLAECAAPVETLSVRYLPDAVEVTCAKPEASLRIAALGRTKALVNGRPVAVSGGMFQPFK